MGHGFPVRLAGCLALTRENTRTSLLRRGAWILEKVFNRRPPPPPPNVNGVLPESVDANTAVEQFAKHSTAANCAGCQARIDPLVSALASETHDPRQAGGDTFVQSRQSPFDQAVSCAGRRGLMAVLLPQLQSAAK